MPILEWRCASCGNETEEIRKIGDSDPPKEKCCDEPAPKRIIGKVNVRKGVSWGPGKGHW